MEEQGGEEGERWRVTLNGTSVGRGPSGSGSRNHYGAKAKPNPDYKPHPSVAYYIGEVV